MKRKYISQDQESGQTYPAMQETQQKYEWEKHFDALEEQMKKDKEATHTPTPLRCKDCHWIHEADSTKGTSFRGIEFCPVHNRAVNNIDKTLKALNDILQANSLEEAKKYANEGLRSL